MFSYPRQFGSIPVKFLPAVAPMRHWTGRPAETLLEQRERLRVRAIRIPRTGQLTACAHVLTGPTQYRAHDRLARIKFTSRRWIIACAQSHNLIMTIGKGEEQNSCARLQVWVCVSRHLDQRLRAKHFACDGTAGSRV